jgi:hypothetical protein
VPNGSIVIAGAGVGGRGVDDGEHGVAGRGQGFLIPHPPGQAPVAGAGEGGGAGGADDRFAEGGAEVGSGNFHAAAASPRGVMTFNPPVQGSSA